VHHLTDLLALLSDDVSVELEGDGDLSSDGNELLQSSGSTFTVGFLALIEKNNHSKI
jgi:hypothetical protein